ncbi:MAG: altronate dehydrogenase [Planctomycetaceae bacterium]
MVANAAAALPETLLQFGAGRFLRAFVDRFVHQANLSGQGAGRVVVVQSTPGARADLLNAQPDGFHVVVRGLSQGATIDRVEPVASISRALSATTQWADVLDVARSPALRWIVTNATEAGYALAPTDRLESQPPAAMPGKLLQVLWARQQAGLPPVVVLPCELIEHNAPKLRQIVLDLARAWGLPEKFLEWAGEQCQWLENLVDCIVTPGPADHPLAARDQLLVSAEPYMLWAIARPADGSRPLFEHPAIEWVDEVAPWYLRKVRLLNGLHTAMAARFRPRGLETVLQVLRDPAAVEWLRGVAYEEILPTLVQRVSGAAQFADAVFERFANPFLAHRLADIANNELAKMQVRLLPTLVDYQRLYGQPPPRLSEVVPASLRSG